MCTHVANRTFRLYHGGARKKRGSAIVPPPLSASLLGEFGTNQALVKKFTRL